MERIKQLNRYQQGILLLLTAMLVVFTVFYLIASSRYGFEYMDSILRPTDEGGVTVYSGRIHGKQAAFTVTEDKTVTFLYGDKIYGPFVAKEDYSAIPEDSSLGPYMTGVEICDGGEVFFRGGVLRSGGELILINEEGDYNSLTITSTTSNGTVVDADGNIVDPMEPSAAVILSLMDGPELTNKCAWEAWLLGVIASVVAAISILFADELFRWNLSLQIRYVDCAEPTDLEIFGRYASWTILTIAAFIFYIMGL